MAGTIKGEALKLQANMGKLYDSGKQAEYDRFWDAYQQNGERTTYNYAFVGEGWNSTTFKPKYDIRPSSCRYMFHMAFGTYSLADLLKQAGVSLDTSNSIKCDYMFYACPVTEVPNIDLTNCTDTSALFYDSLMLKKAEITVSENTKFSTSMFGSNRALTDFTVNGVIGQALNMQSCPVLSPASMKNIILHLKNFKGTSNEHTRTLTFNESCWAALEADSTAPDGGTWKHYVGDVLGWNY